MKKTLSLINSFWHEIENLPKNKKYLITAERGAFCQCGTERFIEITNIRNGAKYKLTFTIAFQKFSIFMLNITSSEED